MFCPSCNQECLVVDTRQMEWYCRRRYRCPRCGTRYTTREVVFVDDTPVWQELRHDTLRRLDEIRLIAKLRGRWCLWENGD